ncbi:hypothetical protein PHMEG_00012029 [Phytophthora megakarya]|uniref:Uncharacterized protein n=1 Tax=Phytophthora megakarya TaxID=4795 RepID=A0A225WAS0_9STRA|nr:hypothetical protein PHMEG_00012029 [Phytophthora megakarya]
MLKLLGDENVETKALWSTNFQLNGHCWLIKDTKERQIALSASNLRKKVTAHKFKWSKDMYDDIFRMCIALTNYNISINPLRDENAHWYRQSQHRLIALGKSIMEKSVSSRKDIELRRNVVWRLRFKIWEAKRMQAKIQ